MVNCVIKRHDQSLVGCFLVYKLTISQITIKNNKNDSCDICFVAAFIASKLTKSERKHADVILLLDYEG
jgi:hypothetical protein